ncbi:hypothetical protein B484DRAFT_426335, partial [Ochromonadaceae sp. CCMP2298]
LGAQGLWAGLGWEGCEGLLSVEALQGVVKEFKVQREVQQFKAVTPVPESPWDQLLATVEAAFRAWSSPAAIKYRDIHGIDAHTTST